MSRGQTCGGRKARARIRPPRPDPAERRVRIVRRQGGSEGGRPAAAARPRPGRPAPTVRGRSPERLRSRGFLQPRVPSPRSTHAGLPRHLCFCFSLPSPPPLHLLLLLPPGVHADSKKAAAGAGYQFWSSTPGSAPATPEKCALQNWGLQRSTPRTIFGHSLGRKHPVFLWVPASSSDASDPPPPVPEVPTQVFA